MCTKAIKNGCEWSEVESVNRAAEVKLEIIYAMEESEESENEDLPMDETTCLERCLEQNLALQDSLQTVLDMVKSALAENRHKQKRLKVFVAQNLSRSDPAGYRNKMWPYFIDYSLEPLIESRSSQEPREKKFLVKQSWSMLDLQRLRAGVRQKNLEALAEPIRDRLEYCSLTEDEEKTLVDQIRELPQTSPDSDQYKYSPDIDWNQLAYENFDNEKTGEQCRLRYKNKDHMGINPGKWSKEEEKRLLILAKDHTMRDWETVAAELGTCRTAFSCFQHYKLCLFPNTRNLEWTPREDAKLKEGLEIFGLTNWHLISNHVGSRTRVQCVCRHSLTTDRHKHRLGRWCKKEDELLLKAIENYGSEGKVWQRVSLVVGTRNPVQCRERWRNVHACHNLLRPWTQEDDKRLLEISDEMLDKGKRISWSEIGKQLNRRDDSCSRRWKKITSVDKQMMFKTRQTKLRQCVKTQYKYADGSTRRRASIITVEDIGDDLLPEETKEELKEYERRLRKKEDLRKKNQSKGSLSEENDGDERVATSSLAPDPSTNSRHHSQAPDSGCSTSRLDATLLPPSDTHQEECAGMRRDPQLDNRDSQTGEFVSSSVGPPLTTASGIPCSTTSTLNPSSSVPGLDIPTWNPAQPNQAFPPVFPGVAGLDNSTAMQWSLLSWTEQLLESIRQHLLQVRHSQHQLLQQQFMQVQQWVSDQTQHQVDNVQSQQALPLQGQNEFPDVQLLSSSSLAPDRPVRPAALSATTMGVDPSRSQEAPPLSNRTSTPPVGAQLYPSLPRLHPSPVIPPSIAHSQVTHALRVEQLPPATVTGHDGDGTCT